MRTTPSAIPANNSESRTQPITSSNTDSTNIPSQNCRHGIQRQTHEPFIPGPLFRCIRCNIVKSIAENAICSDCDVNDPLYGCFESSNEQAQNYFVDTSGEMSCGTTVDIMDCENTPGYMDCENTPTDNMDCENTPGYKIVRETNEKKTPLKPVSIYQEYFANCIEFLFSQLESDASQQEQSNALINYIINNCFVPNDILKSIDLQHMLIMYFVDSGIIELTNFVRELFEHNVHPDDNVSGYFSSCVRDYRVALMETSLCFRQSLRTNTNVYIELISHIHQTYSDDICHWLMVYWYDVHFIDKSFFTQALNLYISNLEPEQQQPLINLWTMVGILPEQDD